MNTATEHKIDILTEKIDVQFERMDQRFEKIDQRFEKIDQRFEKIEENINDLTIHTKMGFDDLGKRVDRNTVSIEKLSSRVSHIEDDLCSFRTTWDSEQAANQLRFQRLEEKLA